MGQSFEDKQFKNELLFGVGSFLFIYILLFIESYFCWKDDWFMSVINGTLVPMSILAAVFALYDIKKFIRQFFKWLLLLSFFFGTLFQLGWLFLYVLFYSGTLSYCGSII
tara:strand:- start:35 stop:364 length:330 start_codon:yes stop_codon:yes gene_type:complete